MRRVRAAVGGVWLVLLALALVACGGGDPAAAGGVPFVPSAASAPPPATLHTGKVRHGAQTVAAAPGAPYNYAPTIIAAGGAYRMWWCSQLPGAARPGDEIVEARATSPDGPFRAADGSAAAAVFGNSAGGFDALHTCDPSVIAVGGTYYLYYTGTADPGGHHNAIGLATSPDGVHWTRANGGRPIVTAAGNQRPDSYGAGQPSAVYLDGWFYLMFTDTTAAAASDTGNGQFVLRSPDPAFRHGVQALENPGFVPVAGTSGPRDRSVFDGTTADWMWVDALGAFAIADDTPHGTEITFWDQGFTRHPYAPVMLPGPWQDGPGLVRRADGHAPVAVTDPCGRVPVDVVRATRSAGAPTGLQHFGVDLTGGPDCATRAQAVAVLNGFAMPAPDRTVEVLADGTLVEVERRSVALLLVRGMLAEPVPVLATVSPAVRLPPAAPGVTAPGRPVGLLVGGKLWVLGPAHAAALNSSAVTTVSTKQWDAYPRGGDLSDLRS